MKFSWNAAVDTQPDVTGLRGVMRDSAGEVHLTFCSTITTAVELEAAEAMALRKSMLLCAELGIPETIFEGGLSKGS